MSIPHDQMTYSQEKAKELEELSQTSPGSPMGRLLRQFWQPIAASEDVKPGSAIPVRILSENLTVYRGESGQPHVVAQRCPHRGTVLHAGWIEGDNIRCMYHGWMFSGNGQCLEQPAEAASFASKVKILSYPALDYGSLIFVYMGEGAPPEFQLLRKPELEREDGVRWVNEQVWPCNWLQQVENSMDAAHVSFVHRWAMKSRLVSAVTGKPPELSYQETEAGILQIATRSEKNTRLSDWTFPNCNHIFTPSQRLHPDDPWTHLFNWMVPVDDHNTRRFSVAYSSVSGEAAIRLRNYITNDWPKYNPADHHEDLFYRKILPEEVEFGLNGVTNAQDYVAQVGQGAIADRSRERLGQSDEGIIFLRKIYLRELKKLKEGLSLKEWKALERPQEMPTQPGEAGEERKVG
jgi:5,5'-dehydrodivanillate O-demethylase oxygenase subunit